MKFLKIFVIAMLVSACCCAQQQPIPKKTILIKKITGSIKIDGLLDDAAWKDAPTTDRFTLLQPTPFAPETAGDETVVKLLYSNAGIYIGGYLHENNKDSVAAELVGRDGFGNNDFLGVVFDTYEDHLNGFEYFVTPLNEQFDAKNSPNSNGNSEDFSWNSVWQSATKMHADGWSVEMFIPYSAIRFGKKNIQNWGLNLVRKRRKTGQQIFWQPIDPAVNGFMTQEGTLKGFENIKPPLRLQFSPYFSTYYNHNGEDLFGIKSGVSVNGGMDVKYGINQAFTLDMTLIPDFGQVQTDNLTLNLSPFEQKFSDNRPFFTEGTELFSKGNLFYSRRIGGAPIHQYDYSLAPGETVTENPAKSKLVNATKISGRTQKGLGIGFLNAVTKPTEAIIEDGAGHVRRFETDPLTNYNVFVLDQTMKHHSSVSFVNTSVIRSGSDPDADVAAALFDLNDKKNKWNGGGNVSVSTIIDHGKSVTGYAQNFYFGKVSGRFNFNISHELYDDKYNKNDLGYFTNNNYINNNVWAGYNWNTPKAWYNRVNINANVNQGSLVTPLDFLKGRDNMFGSIDLNMNGEAQTKKLWVIDVNGHIGTAYNDFYEPRDIGRVFWNKGSRGVNINVGSNSAKKFSGDVGLFAGSGGVFHRTSFNPGVDAKYRFNSKFSLQAFINVTDARNAAGFTDIRRDQASGHTVATDTILFARRDVDGVENSVVIKYSFNNRMSLNFRARHYWTKVTPRQLYQLDVYSHLQTPDAALTSPARPDPISPDNYRQNVNFLNVDADYNWEFTRGSFITVAWKDIGNAYATSFLRNYSKNLQDIITGKQFTSFSVKIIYFLDYASLRNKQRG